MSLCAWYAGLWIMGFLPVFALITVVNSVHSYKVVSQPLIYASENVDDIRATSKTVLPGDENHQAQVPSAINHNEFICGVCNCSKENPASQHHLIANCENKNLHAIPAGLPVELWSLRLSYNKINSLPTSDILYYPKMEHAVMSSCKISRVTSNNTVHNLTSPLLFLDLSANNIKSITDGSFRLLPKLKTLLLNKNKLDRITNYTLEGLTELTRLDVSTNSIKCIEYGAFQHTTHLTFLNLSHNKVFGYTWKFLPSDLFEPLRELKVIDLQYIARGELNYPNKALGMLTNLEQLYIDGLGNDVEFGPQLQTLRNLTHLHIGGGTHCSLKNISSTFFQNIPYIKYLYIYSCKVMHVDFTAFSKINLTLLSLKVLDNYDLYTAFDDLQGLQYSSLKSLHFIHLYHSTYPCRYLNAAQAKYIRNIALDELDLSSNRLALLGDDFLQKLPRTLKRLVLRENQLSLKSFILNRIDYLKDLITLDLSEQNADVPWNVPQQLEKCPVSRLHSTSSSEGRFQNFEIVKQNFNASSPSEPVGVRKKCSKLFTPARLSLTTAYDVNAPPLKIPPSLQVLKASQYSSFGTILFINHLDPNNSLTDIDFSESFLTTWGHGFLPATFQIIKLSKNFCKHINPQFFPKNNSVKFLDLSDNSLGSDFAVDINGTIFSTLTNAIELDISRNLIYKLSRQFFRGLKHLVSLRLSENKLQTLNSSFAHMKHLRLLDLSKNSIVWIDKRVRDELDEIGEKLSIDLTSNPLSCTCSSLEQIVWMMKTKITLLNEDYLYCTFDDGIDRPIGNLQKRVQSLQRMCASKALVIVVCVALICLLGTVAGFVVIYRNRWKLRYIRNIAVAKLVGFEPNGANDEGFRFDAYILYTENTRNFVINDCLRELEEKRGHKLCVADRNFLPGTLIISDIVSAVQNSSKTVPVSEPGLYADDEYSEYSVKMAIMEEVFKARQVLHVIVLEPTPADDMPVDLLVAMKRNSYTEFPPADERNEELLEHFWDQVSLAIGHTANNRQ
ncbi:toll-like receptor 4 [Physella acuta]|uniref:toll-like receptor 4 n=1 Tax=Physella acuta TaxID=109671 RepID=UPI0027DD1921|nr:toll-like receptor 4 [Physella acuta]